MKYLATLIALTFFLFVPNSVAFNRDRHDERLPKLYELLKKGDALEKRVALQMLYALHGPKYHKNKFIIPILELLNDKNPKVREAAAAKFKRLAGGYKSSFYKSDVANKSVVPALIQALSDKSASVRIEAAKALGYYKDLRAVKPLIPLLQDRDIWVRFEAIRALGRINAGAEAVVPLMNVVVGDDVWPTKLLQQEALQTLVSMLNQSSVTVLQKSAKEKYFKNGITIRKTLIDPRIQGKIISILLKKSQSPYLKADIIQLMGLMHIHHHGGMTEKVMKHLFASTGDSNAQVRRRALASMYAIVHQFGRNNDSTDITEIIQTYRSMVTGLCIKALKDPSMPVRKKAIYILGELEEIKAIEPLISALNDGNSDEKIAVIKALGHYKDNRVIAPLLAALSDQSETVRINAVELLGDYNDLDVVRALPRYFESFEKSDDNRLVARTFWKVAQATKHGTRLVYHYNGKRCVHTIAVAVPAILPHDVDTKTVKLLLRHATAVESILQALSDPKFKGCVQALEMLARFEDERIAQHIMPFIDNPSAPIRRAVLPLVYLAFDSDTVKAILQQALKDEDIKVQKEAGKLSDFLEANHINDVNTSESYIDALNSRDSDSRLAAIKAMMGLNDGKMSFQLINRIEGTLNTSKQLMDKRAVEPLINCLDDADPRVRRYAAMALKRLNDKRAVKPLIQRLDDSDVQVRRRSKEALKRLRDPTAVEPLLALTDDKNMKMEVMDALSCFDDPRVADFFVPLLQNQNEKLQLAAVKYFAKNPNQNAIEFLIPLLQSSYGDIPYYAIDALAKSKDPRAVDPLIELLNTKPESDDEKGKRRIYRFQSHAIHYLGSMDDKRVYPILINALTDEHLKRFAILALGDLKDRRAVPVLIDYLSDPSSFFRSLAIRSLGQIGDSSVFNTLVPFLSDPYEPISNSAIYAVYRLDPEKALDILHGMLDTKDPVTCGRILRLMGCPKNKNLFSKWVEIAAEKKEFSTVIGKRLNNCKDPEITATLQSYLKEGMNPDIKAAVIDILGEFDAPDIKNVLSRYTDDQNPMIVRHARKALKKPEDVLIATLFESESFHYVKFARGKYKIHKKRYFIERPILSSMGQSGLSKYGLESGNGALRHDPQIEKMIKHYKYEGYTCVQLPFETPVTVEKLIQQLKDPSPINRRKACSYLGYLADTKAISNIVSLLNDRNPSVRLAAVRALGLSNDTSVWSSLANALNDSDMNVTAMAARALGETNNEKAVKPLSAYIEKHPELRIKEIGIRELAKISGKAVREVLIVWLPGNEDYRVRMLVADEFGRLGDATLAAHLGPSLRDPNEYVRQAAVRSLGMLNAKESVPLLTKCLNDDDFHVRKAAIETVGQIRDLRPLGALSQLLMDEDGRIQKKSMEILRKYTEDVDAKRIMGDIFLSGITSDDPKDLRKSEKLLSILGKDYAIIRLADPAGDELKSIYRYLDLMLLEYRSRELSKSGKHALTEFEDRALVLDTLTTFIMNCSSEDRKRYQVVYFLSGLNDTRSAPLFVHILENASSFKPHEIKTACAFLGRAEYKAAAPLLRQRLSNSGEHYSVKLEVVRALGKFGDKKAVDSLIKIAESSSEHQDLRIAAVKALGSIGDPRSAISLTEVLNDSNAILFLRAAAANSLGKIGNKQAIQALEKAEKSLGDSKEDKLIKQAIKNALQ